MANHKSAVKSARQIKKRSLRNQQIQSKLRTTESALLKKIENKDKETSKKFLDLFVSQMGKASRKGVIQKERASRKVSRLSKKYYQSFQKN